MPYFKYPTQKPGEKIALLARRLTCQFFAAAPTAAGAQPRPARVAQPQPATRNPLLAR